MNWSNGLYGLFAVIAGTFFGYDWAHGNTGWMIAQGFLCLFCLAGTCVDWNRH